MPRAHAAEMALQCNLGMTLIYTNGMVDGVRVALTRALLLAREFADFDFQQRATLNLWLFSAPRGAHSMTRSQSLSNLRESLA